MANVRPTPTSYYYSGQGRLGIGTRTADGKYQSLVFVGNVTGLTVNIATTKFEHKESMTGQRGIDLTIVQEKNATFTFTAESLTLSLLALGLYGNHSSVDAAVVAQEEHTITEAGTAIPLMHPNVSDVVITNTSGGGPVTEDMYDVDEGFGTIYPKGAGLPVGTYQVAYKHGAFDQIDAFTNATPPERYLRFEGLNTVNGDLRLIEIPRAAFDPLTGLEFINEELGAGEFNGNVLPDTTIVAADRSQYFRERRVYSQGGGGSTAPSPVSAQVEDATPEKLDVTFDAAITSAPPTGAGGFAVTSSGSGVTATAVAISGAVVSLTLSRAITAGESLSVAYTPPSTNPLAGAGGLVPSFVGQVVTNSVA